jgi:hypothetical protein
MSREIIQDCGKYVLEREITEYKVELTLLYLPLRSKGWGNGERDYTILFSDNTVVRRVVRYNWFGTGVVYELELKLEGSDAEKLKELMLNAREIGDYNKVIEFLCNVKTKYNVKEWRL